MKNIYTNDIISQTDLIKENRELRTFKLDGLQIGVFYKISKWKISALATNSDFLYKNSGFVSERDRIDFQLELSYQMN